MSLLLLRPHRLGTFVDPTAQADAVFDTVTCRTLNAGYDPDTGLADDNAAHTIHGSTAITGAADTVVLTVEQRTVLEGLLNTRSLEVGLTVNPDPAQDDPYAPSVTEELPYPDDGATPAQTGLTIDEGGNIRMTGFIVAKHGPGAVILRAQNGHYYQFEVAPGGVLSAVGTDLGATPP